MATPLPFQALDDQPRLHFAEFERQVFDDAGSTCTDIFQHGLLFLVVSDAIWASLPNNSVTVEGITTIRQRPVHAVPIQPQDNATTGIWKAFETRRKIFDIYNVASLLLLRRIKLSLPAADTALLSHPVLGLVNLTALEIMNHLRLQYGVFRVTDFNILYLKLEETMGCKSQFADFASRFRLIFAQFASNNQPISELQQCNFLCRSIASHADLVKAQDSFFNLFPDPNLRTFAALVAHITIHAPNFSRTTSDLGYTATAIAGTDNDSIQSFLKSPQFVAALASAAAANSRPNSSPRHQRSEKPPRKYCFLHGYDWHQSKDCRIMAKDIATYNSAARAATTHELPTGGSKIRFSKN